jgi:hypothetical protein
MTVLAEYPGLQLFQLRGVSVNGSGGVASEAADHVFVRHLAAGGLRDVFGLGSGRAESEVQATDGLIETHAAFIVDPAALEYVGLAGLAQTEGPTRPAR